MLKALKGDEQINLKKADRGTITVIMTKEDETRKSTKTDFARKLVPIQQTELLANTRNSLGH